jgi:hypothetical protein
MKNKYIYKMYKVQEYTTTLFILLNAIVGILLDVANNCIITGGELIVIMITTITTWRR